MVQQDGRVIQSIQRSIDIMECFDEENRELSLSEISRMTSLNKSTVHGILNTLYYNGYISKNPDNNKYSLGSKFITKGNLVTSSIDHQLKEIGIQHIIKITDKYKVTTHLFACFSNSLFLLKMQVPANFYYIVSSVVGKKMPLHATASGKIVLAHMSEKSLRRYFEQEETPEFTEKTITDAAQLKKELAIFKEKGYTYEDEEVEKGVSSIAVPVYNQEVLVATISLTASKQKVESIFSEVVKDMKAASEAISSALSYH